MNTEFDIGAARQHLRDRQRSVAVENERLHEKACADAGAIIEMLIQKHDPVRIYQWGSLLNKTLFCDHSDIDIGLEGITSAAEIFEIYGEVMAITQFPVDLVQMEKIEPEFAAIIREKGRIVYERE